MKILAFNSSPRMEKGATDILLNRFLEGAKYAGAEAEKIFLKNKKINNCIGCFSCWLDTPGVCIFKDDMTEILEKMREAELWVFGTPIYHDTMTSYLKTAIERTLPFKHPLFKKYKDRTIHPWRYPEDEGKHKMVIISVCAFPEKSHFDALSYTFKKISINMEVPIVCEIFFPASMLLLSKKGARYTDKFLKAVYSAGEEIVKKGKISAKTKEILNKEIEIPKRHFLLMANRWWKKRIKLG